MTDPMTSVILAAGLGTRMRSRRAKVLHQIGGRTLLEWVLDALGEAGVERHVVVVGHQAAEVRAAAGGAGVRFALQEPQHGTGHALQCAAAELPAGDEVVLVTVGDAPLVRPATYRMLLDRHLERGADATVLTARPADPEGYGRVLREGTGGPVLGIVEQRDASPEERAVGEVNSGIYAYRARALHRALGDLRPDNDQGELYLTDTVGSIVAAGGDVHAVCAADPDELMGINTRAQLAQAGAVLIERKIDALMAAGVTIEQPRATWIEPTVSIGADTVVEPFAHLSGGTRIGIGCRIGAGAILRDVVVEDGDDVAAGASLDGAAR